LHAPAEEHDMPTVIRRSQTVTVSERRRPVRPGQGWQAAGGAWSPPTDLFETAEEYVISVEIAGLRETDFEVVYENGVLIISGERPDRTERRAYHQMEIRFGKFSTALALPGPVDLDASKAEYRNGFLVVQLPKPKRVDVRIED
jgi:HSP20 family protein